jgi:hypothetical protein
MSALHDEIVIIFVSENRAEATLETFRQTPFLVRRGHILHAINWLKENNPLYNDVVIDLAALAEYPDEDGCIPFPIQYQSPTDTVLGQNATYTGYGIDTTEAIFAEQQGREGDIPLYICPAISTLKMVAVSCAYPPVAVFMPLCWDQNSRSNIQEKR